jgi:hypothetical protein
MMDLGEIGWCGVDLIGLAQDREKLSALMNSVMNLRVPQITYFEIAAFFPPLVLNIAFSMKTMSVLYANKKTSVALVRERTIPTERPLLVGEVSVNF